MNPVPRAEPKDHSGVFRVLAVRHAEIKDAKRRERRLRIHHSVVHPIDTPRRIPDPLEHKVPGLVSAVTATRLLAGAAVLHLVTVGALFIVNQFIGDHRRLSSPERVQVSIVKQPTAEPKPVKQLPERDGPAPPDFERKKPKPEVTKQETSQPTAPPEAYPEPAATPENPIPQRIVGLNLESTVEGNSAAFATGTSRMGSTDRTAAAPERAAQVPTQATPSARTGTGQAKPEQRAATRIPTRDVDFVKPKRQRQTDAPYPATLKAQGIEGEVLLRIDIDASGRVTNVAIVRSSGHQAFDRAARTAAKRDTYSPAMRDGKPVPFTLSYTYRFQIKDR